MIHVLASFQLQYIVVYWLWSPWFGGLLLFSESACIISRNGRYVRGRGCLRGCRRQPCAVRLRIYTSLQVDICFWIVERCEAYRTVFTDVNMRRVITSGQTAMKARHETDHSLPSGLRYELRCPLCSVTCSISVRALCKDLGIFSIFEIDCRPEIRSNKLRSRARKKLLAVRSASPRFWMMIAGIVTHKNTKADTKEPQTQAITIMSAGCCSILVFRVSRASREIVGFCQPRLCI